VFENARVTRRLTRTICLLLLLIAPRIVAAQSDPLPSWNDGVARQSIVSFIQTVTDRASPQFVPVEQRIATFDNDGTLWAEQPIYFQLAFALDRVRALAPKHPEWKTKQPFKAVLDGDMKAVAARSGSASASVRLSDSTAKAGDITAADVAIKDLGKCLLPSPVVAHLGESAVVFVGAAEKVLVDDRMSVIRANAAHATSLPAFELAGPRNKVFFDPRTVGCGIVYRTSTTGKHSVIYRFTGGADGWLPSGSLVNDDAGNLYGATSLGGKLRDGSGRRAFRPRRAGGSIRSSRLS